jgi:TetR/AcrR family transcriptional repressor of bet genes
LYLRANETLNSTHNRPAEDQQPRRYSSEDSRRLLIDATLDSIVEIGFSSTSISEIVNRARLSRGMVHLYFDNKNALLVAAADHAAKTYYSRLSNQLAETSSCPQAILETVILSDLGEALLNQRTVKIWFAFRGEAHSNKSIAQFSDTRDKPLRDLIFKAFLEITTAQQLPDPGKIARDATHGTLAMLEGMWTDYLLHSDSFSRASAARIIFRFLSALFPLHFSLDGAIVQRDGPDPAP